MNQDDPCAQRSGPGSGRRVATRAGLAALIRPYAWIADYLDALLHCAAESR
jgi:hypothetical protein